VKQANAFQPNWGQTIFQSANEMASNQMIRKRMDELQAQKDSEREWWNHRKTSIETDFMKELDGDASKVKAKAPASRASDDDAVLVEAGGPAEKGQSGKENKKKKGKN
jgi:translocation protein SEC66